MSEGKARSRSNSGPLFGASKEEPIAADAAFDDLPAGMLPEVGTVIVDKYRIDRLIARGGMGAVYAATHLVHGKRVALKWMLPALGQVKGARERFVREACATARIEHPNIVNIYDVGSERGSVFLVMEYLRGETLCDRLEREPLSPQQAIALLIPALRGVAAAHAHGVIHRDLKPENIFLCYDESGELLEPKVLDFGISKFLSSETADHSLTRSGAVLGTPYYMSPEQVRGARSVDARADVYAFGVMLYEALTGQRPFDAETYNELILKIATETPPRPGDLNPALDSHLTAVIEQAMSRDPETRYPTIQALAVALEPFAGGVRFRSAKTGLELSAPTLPPSVPDVAPIVHKRSISAANSGAHTRARTTLLSAVIALLACSAALLFWHTLVPLNRTTKQQPAAAQLRPAPLAPSHDEPALAPAPASTLEQTAQLILPDGIETSTNAAQALPSDGAVLAQRTRVTSLRRPLASSRTFSREAREAREMRDARDGHESEPPSAALAPPMLIKRIAPSDWDDRLSNEPRRTQASDVPAGRIEARDFR
jgi:serine/threonine protein kinase